MSGDYSRRTFDARNNFSGVLMQQGRVQLDADWNEQVAIGERRLSAETVDILGRAMVPKETQDGFRIEVNAGQLLIHPGRMYVDGLLAENHGQDPVVFDAVLSEERGTEPCDYEEQPYLPNAGDVEPLPAGGPHIAYLDVWQREVTHVKQPGLVEPAVGVDTTARSQIVWQVKMLEVEGEPDLECSDTPDEWEALVEPSAGRLSTGTVEVPPEDNPCLLPPGSGYRGLEHRLYRVEIHQGGALGAATFKWARHNASIETSVTHIDGTELTVVQSQWDAIRRFNVNDWVEVTDDVRELSGQPGEMRRIDDVNYAKNTINLNSALPAVDFPTSGPEHETDPDRHTRIRRWDQKQDVDPVTGLLDVDATPVHLEHGIEITFSIDAANPGGKFKPGDYWLFYARSNDASVEILDEAPPRGIHHHYAKLAIVTFPDTLVEDCRPQWPPPFGSEGCCTASVGDGVASHGDFDNVQDAVDSLPAAGGKVCVLPGIYEENVHVNGRANVTISGCGKRSRIVAPAPEDPSTDADPAIYIENSAGIHIDALSIEAHMSGIGVLVEETTPDPDGPTPLPVEDIHLSNLFVVAAFGSAIEFRSGQGLTVRECHVTMRDVPSDWPGIFLIGEDALIERNVVTMEFTTTAGGGDEFVDDETLMISAGRGGIQVGGTSERVRIRENLIQHGLGDGITLGSLVEVDDSGEGVTGIVAWPEGQDDPCDPCAPPSPRVPPRGGDDEEEPPTYVSAGPLYDLLIEGNRIFDMGRNGIGVAAFFDLSALDEFITVERLTIRENEIRRCLNKPLGEIDDAMVDSMGYGGIALADVTDLVIHHNVIEDNGPDYLEPVNGIFGLHIEGGDVTDNRIVNNGAKTGGELEDAKRGRRGGINIVYAVPPTVPVGPSSSSSALRDVGRFPRQNGVPAMKIHDNIVSQPLGRALSLVALGPVSVVNNQFTSRGVMDLGTPLAPSTLAATVMIMNLGVSNEFYGQLLGLGGLKGGFNASNTYAFADAGEESIAFTPGNTLDDLRVGRYLANGNVLFSDNQCVLDLLDSRGFDFALSSVTIVSLDDVGFHSNQCDCSLLDDFLFFPNFLLAASLRVSDNRFKEGLVNAVISAVTFGLMNATTGNQATHCLLVIGHPALKVEEHNKVIFNFLLSSVLDRPICDIVKGFLGTTFGDWL